ncbi:MAG TPA: hypothetical protein VD905_01430 [Flavobacteriales bacterium]|nr:hypothetical protein [Flavobacteriales bacterium]
MTNNYRKPGQISHELLAQLKKNKPKKQEWHWSFTVTIIGIIAGGILTLVVASFTLISYTYLFLGVLGIALLGFVAQWKLFYSQKFIQQHFRMPLGIYALYNFGGIALSLTALLLTLN